jgi:hypothetical protein
MKKIFYIALFVISSLSVTAQTERQLTVSEIRQQTLLNEPITLQKGYFRWITSFNFALFSTDYFDNSWKKITTNNYSSNSMIVPFSLCYGLTNNLEINLNSNYTQSKSSFNYQSIDNYSQQANQSIKVNKKSAGFNDLSIALNYKLLDEKDNYPSLAVGIYGSIPYGKKDPTSDDDGINVDEGVSCGYYEIGLGTQVKKVYYPFSIAGVLMYAYSFPTDLRLKYNDIEKTTVDFGDFFQSKLIVNYMPSDWISISNNIVFTHNGKSVYDNEEYKHNEKEMIQLMWEPGLTFQMKNFRLRQSISFVAFGKNSHTTPIFSIVLHVKI